MAKQTKGKGASTGFFPDDYTVPSGSGNYMKFDGESKLRILSDPIFGYIEWVDKKPLRTTMDEGKPETTDPKNPPKHFWAMKVYDYQDKGIKILEITQASVQKAIKALNDDKDWGNPQGYDLKIVKKGEGLKTKYTVTPSNKKPVGKDILKLLAEKEINLEALFEGEDPFGGDKE